VTNVGRDALIASARARMRRIGKSLRPDEDWAPIAFVLGGDGAISVVSLPGENWSELLLAAAAPLNPQAVCVVNTQWIGVLDEREERRATIDPEDVPRPSERVERAECVMLHAADRTGVTLEIAMITRRQDRPPTLAVFEPAPGDPLPAPKIAEVFTLLLGPGWMGRTAEAGPIDTEGLSTLHEHLAEAGAYFDGNPFALFVPVTAPEVKTVAVLACHPTVVERTAGKPNGLAIEAIEVGSDIALRIAFTLFDNPRMPLVLAPVLNPTVDTAREMIGDLAARRVWELMFLHCDDGSPIGTRYLPVDQDQLRSLEQLLEITAEREPITAERWQAISAKLQVG
jgi:hypothetical protein